MPADPLVSVIIPAYNRSYVLRHAVQSVLGSTLQDFEVLVVGDHCTDESEAVVAAISDARVRFINLPERCGEQSGPNNHGLALARGRFIAFLNQDDLYFPDHLRATVDALERSDADLLWTPVLRTEPVSEDELRSRQWRVLLGGVPATGAYDPLIFYVASSWVFKRRFLEIAGRWRMGREIYVSPSQDWLYQAWRRGARLALHPHASVLMVSSGARANSYARRSSPEHDVYASELRNPSFRVELLEASALSLGREAVLRGHPKLTRRLVRTCAAPLRYLFARAGAHPGSAHLVVRLYRRGTFIERHRRVVGA